MIEFEYVVMLVIWLVVSGWVCITLVNWVNKTF